MFRGKRRVSGKRVGKRRILSLGMRREYAVSAWSVRVVTFWGEEIVKAKQRGTFIFTLRETKERRSHRDYSRGDTILVYRAHFERVIAFPKPIRDQVALLLSARCGLRSGEVAKQRIEHCDVEKLVLLVEDSKKHVFYPVPITFEVANTIQELLRLEDRSEGFLIIQHGRCAWRRGKAITTIGLCWIWKKWARKAGVSNWQDYNPTYARHYFAVTWDKKGGSIKKLQVILRHKNITTTVIYLSKLSCFEDVQAEVLRLQAMPNMEQKGLEGCVNCEICKFFEPAATGGCIHEAVCRFNVRGEVQKA